MYPNFILLLLYIIIMHGNKDRVQTEGHKQNLTRNALGGVVLPLSCGKVFILL